MGRWTFPEGQEPLYIPDEGEQGGGGLMNHLAMALGGAHEKILGSKPVQLAGQVAGMPARAVTAVGHSMAEGGYKGKTDPIDYIMTGQKEDEADLAHYGDLLADTMEAEGTINEQGWASWAIRKAGEAISDPLVLFGAARATARMARGGRPAPPSASRTGARPRSRLSPNQPRPMDTTPGQTGAGPQFRGPKDPSQGPGPGGGGVAGGPGSPKQPKAKPTRYRYPPVDEADAARFPSAPLDRDLASPGVFTTGGPKSVGYGARGPKGGKAARQASRRQRAREMGREEQLQEGVGKMRQEQLDQGVARMNEQELGMRPGALGPDATQPIWLQQNTNVPPAGSPGSTVVPRADLQEILDAAVQGGASPQAIRNLIINLSPGDLLNPGF